LLVLSIATLFFAGSCMKNNTPDPDGPDSDIITEEIVVPEGFDWSMTKTLNISVILPDGDISKPLRIYTQDETELLYIGYATGESNMVNSQITIPSYLEIVKVFYGFEDFYVPFEIGIDESLSYNFDEGGITTKSLKDSDDDYDTCCKDGLVSITLRYDGEDDAIIEIYKKKGKKEHERIFFTDGYISSGDTFTITGDDGEKLDKDLYIHINNNNKENTKIKVDCKAKIYVGDDYGDFTITAGISKDNLELCSEGSGGSDECGCEGGLAYLKLRYVGSSDAEIVVKEKKDLKVIYSNNTVSENQEFSFTGTKKDGRLDNMIYVYVDGSLNAELHVSCSVPIEIGDLVGDFKIAAASNGKNLSLCGTIDPVPDPDPAPPGNTTTNSEDGTLAFEDLWPSKGDYDFNDLVIDYDFSVTKNEDAELISITAIFTIKSFGASFHNGFGFQLPGVVDGDIVSVSGFDVENGGIFSLSNKGLENSQDIATIIVYDDSYRLMPHPGNGNGIGVNTTANATYVQPVTVTLQIAFVDGAVANYDIGSFNPFIIVNQDRTKEVHLVNFPPTKLAATDVFGSFNDDSNLPNRTYISEIGLPWAINIPELFEYPYEKTEITAGYLKFASWAESGNSIDTDWFIAAEANNSAYRNNTYIYTKPN